MFYQQDIFWNNIPYTKGRYLKKLGYLDKNLFKNTFLENQKNPCIIWTGTGKIKPLEDFKLKEKSRNILKKKNIEFHFYLYEPICTRIGSFNRSFYSEFLSTDNTKNMVSDEIESILKFTKENEITNFVIFTTDYKIQLIKDRYPDIRIHCLDIFLREVSLGFQKYPKLENKILKKFWCGNWRYAVHRHLVTSYLYNSNSTLTWNLKCSYDTVKSNEWFNFDKFKNCDPARHQQLKLGIDFLYNNILSIDQNIEAVEVTNINDVVIPGHNAPEKNDEFLQSHTECFCAVVNETRFAQPFGNISEKTLIPINYKLPFVLVAPPHSLEYLKTFGFKTFDQWWDESYDSEEDHYTRLLKIFDVIDYINSKSLDELKIIYNEMLGVLNHNRMIVNSIPLNSQFL